MKERNFIKNKDFKVWKKPKVKPLIPDSVKKEARKLRMEYIANIAMAFYDFYKSESRKKSYLNKKDIHKISNCSAEYIFDMIFGKTDSKGIKGDGAYKHASIINKYKSKN